MGGSPPRFYQHFRYQSSRRRYCTVPAEENYFTDQNPLSFSANSSIDRECWIDPFFHSSSFRMCSASVCVYPRPRNKYVTSASAPNSLTLAVLSPVRAIVT